MLRGHLNHVVRNRILRRAIGSVALGLPLTFWTQGAFAQQQIVNGTFDNNSNFQSGANITASAANVGKWQTAPAWIWSGTGGNPGGVAACTASDNALVQIVPMPASGTLDFSFQYISPNSVWWVDAFYMNEGQSFTSVYSSVPGNTAFNEIQLNAAASYSSQGPLLINRNASFGYIAFTFWCGGGAGLGIDNVSVIPTGSGGGGGGGGTAPAPTGVTRTFDGGGGADQNWGTALNWDGDTTIPAAGDNVVFGTGGTASAQSVAGSVNNMTFSRGAAFALNTSGTNDILIGGTVAVNDAFTYTINPQLTLGNPTISFNIGSTGMLVQAGKISGGTSGITKTGTGTLQITNTTNDFTGVVNVDAGTLDLRTTGSGQLGSGSNPINLGATSGSASATLLFGNSNTTITRPIVVQAGNTGTMVIRMPSSSGTARNINALVTTNKNVNIDVNGVNGGSVNQDEGNLILNNGLTIASGTVTKTGFGALVVNGTTNLSGTFLDNGAGTIAFTGPINLGAATRTMGSSQDVPGFNQNVNINGVISATDPAAGLIISGNADVRFISSQTHTFTGLLDIQGAERWRGTGGSLAAPVNLGNLNAILDVRATYTIAGLSGTGKVFDDEDAQPTRTLQINVPTTKSYAFGGLIKNLTGTAGDLFQVSSMAITKQGPGTQQFTTTNSYSGATRIEGGALGANSGVGLPTANQLQLRGGVLESIGAQTFNWNLGTGANQVNWGGGGGGFSANGGVMTVNLNGGTGQVTWNAGSFVTDGNPLIFGSETASNTTAFANAIQLGTSGTNTREFRVNDNAGSLVDLARITGIISGSSTQTLRKTGTGVLELAAANDMSGNLQPDAGELRLGAANANIANVSGTGNLVVQTTGALTANSVRLGGKLEIQGAGTVTMRANGTNAGASKVTTLNFTAAPTPLVPLNILFMVNNAGSLNTTDTAVRNFLTNASFFPAGNTVTVVGQDTNVFSGGTPLIQGKQLALISESVGSGNSAASFSNGAGLNMRTMTTPLISWEPSNYDEIGYSAAGGSGGTFTQVAVPAVPNPAIPAALYDGLTVGGNTTIFGTGTAGESLNALGGTVGAGVLQVAGAVGDGTRGMFYIPQGGALSSAVPSSGPDYTSGGTAGGKRLTYLFDGGNSGSDAASFMLGTPPVNGTVAAQNNFLSVVNFMAGVTGAGGGASTGKLNLKDNDLVIDNGVLADVKAQLVSGYNNGAWNGIGIMSDLLQLPANSDKALGYAAGNDPAIAALGGSLSGQTFTTSTAVLVKYTYKADANLDGVVNLADLITLSANFNQPGTKNWVNCDTNYDGAVNLADLITLAANWQKGNPTPLGLSFADAMAQIPEFANFTVVPEPGTLGVLGLGVIGLLGRRRRR